MKYISKLEVAKSLIKNTDFDDVRIACLMAIPVELVSETRQKLAKEENKNAH